MIGAVFTQGVGFEVKECPLPDISENEILLKVKASSICGTDIRIIKNGQRKLQSGESVILGHEFAGVVEKAGAKVNGFAPGTRVGVAPNIGCGQCDCCIQGLTNMCPDYSAFGINFDGAHSEYVRVPAEAIAQGNVVCLPDGISFMEATLIEPLSCVVNGSRASEIRLGDTVVVIGAGPIGFMHMTLARLSGAAKIVAVDIQQHRLDAAFEHGADIIINSANDNISERIMHETDNRGADVVIAACSVPEIQQDSLGFLAPYGRACFFGGLPKDKSHINIDSNLIHYKNLIATGVTGGSLLDFRLAMKLIAGKRVDVVKMVSHKFLIKDMAEAFDTSMNGETMKVVLISE